MRKNTVTENSMNWLFQAAKAKERGDMRQMEADISMATSVLSMLR